MISVLSLAIVSAALVGATAQTPSPSIADLPEAPMALATGPWREEAELIAPRAGLGATVLDDLIYSAGGAGLVEPRADFEVFDPLSSNWRPLSAVPVGVEGFGITAWRDRIWLAGGYTSETRAEPSDQVWSYDPQMDVWQSETPLAGPKASFALVAVMDRLVALGGEHGFEDLMVYDPASVEWSARAAPDETRRRGAAAVVLNDEIWLIGGVRDGLSSARVDIYDPESDDWREGPALPQPRAGHSAAIVNGELHVFGGRSADMRTTLDEHWVLTDGRWVPQAAMPVPRTEAAIAVLGGEVWLIGGGAGSGFFAPFTAVDSVDVYTPQQ